MLVRIQEVKNAKNKELLSLYRQNNWLYIEMFKHMFNVINLYANHYFSRAQPFLTINFYNITQLTQ